MKGIRRRGIAGLAVLLTFLASTAWGAVPQEALSAKPEGAVYAVLNVDDLGGLARNILSSENIDLFAPLMDEDTLNGARMASAIVSKMPVRDAALVVGTDENLVPFLQIALALPEDLRPKLDLVANGKAKAEDIVSLVLGDGALAFGPLIAAVPEQGAQGTWYSLNGQLAVAAREGLLLVGLSSADLEASIKALAAPTERLAVKRRHEARSFSMLHLDFPTLLKIAKEQEAKEKSGEKEEKKLDDVDLNALRDYFKAPLEIEYGFERKPDSFLVSMAANVEEALNSVYLKRLSQLKPVPGGELFLTGAGRPLFALSSKVSFKGADLEVYPEIAKLWKEGIQTLARYGITEAEVESLLSGSVSLVCGGSSTFAGAKTSGVYLALTGRDGAASSIFRKATENEELAAMLPAAPVDVKDWEKVLQVDPAMLPVSALLGVKGETLFLGLQDAASLNAAPELSERLKALLEKTSMGTSFIDFESIQAFLNGAVNDRSSPLHDLLANLHPAMLGLVKDVLGAELSIPFIGVWTPRFDTAFAEHALVDVPADKGLMARIVRAASQFKSASEPSPLDRLTSARAVAEPVFKANPKIEDAELEDLAEALEGTVVLLQKDGVLYIGTVADANFREELVSRAKELGLKGSAGLDILPGQEDYASQEIVWMAVER